MLNKKFYIHSVYANGNKFDCHHPECRFSTTSLTEVAEHVVSNQFVVRYEQKRTLTPRTTS